MTKSPIERFYKLVQFTNDCWFWNGAKLPNGYGVFHYHRKVWYAHRVSWELHRGKIPGGLNVLHNCPNGDNRSCVNPKHLFVGTQKQNIEDAIKKGTIARGENLPQAKLKAMDVLEIRKHYESGDKTQNQLAFAYGVKQQAICKIVNRQRWTHI